MARWRDDENCKTQQLLRCKKIGLTEIEVKRCKDVFVCVVLDFGVAACVRGSQSSHSRGVRMSPQTIRTAVSVTGMSLNMRGQHN